jgi:hypothetical protein
VNALIDSGRRHGILSTTILALVVTFASSVNADPALPTDGLVFHVEADIGVTVTDMTTDVTTWADQSGQGNDLTAAGAPQLVSDALNGQPVISFDGVDDILERTADVMGLPAGDADRTMFVVVNYDSTGYGGTAYGTAATNETFGLIVAGPPAPGNLAVQAWGVGNDKLSATAGTGAGWMVQSAVAGSGGLTHYQNGVAIDAQVHTYATNVGSIVVGAEIDRAPFMDMDVAAIAIYDRALTDEERGDVEKYFAVKYFGGVDIAITSPTEGETVSSGDVTVTYDSAGTAFDEVQLVLDDGAGDKTVLLADDDGSHTFAGVAEGAHTVTATLYDNGNPVVLDNSTTTVNFAAADCAPDNFAPNCTVDTDGDGTPDSAETEAADTDGDGNPDYLESSIDDADMDGTPDQADSDDADVCVPSQFGTGCTIDTDGDGDPDSVEGETTDTDGDGIPDWEESSVTDTDNDGTPDEADSTNNSPPPPPPPVSSGGGGSADLIWLMALGGLLAIRRRRY